mmetsp:Transcript_56898/g.161517  ORF Transcript_56898/g.161517 Transcript_56898/m.161517 type:complete len:207 (+) Transcript_56898:274-894(+)
MTLRQALLMKSWISSSAPGTPSTTQEVFRPFSGPMTFSVFLVHLATAGPMTFSSSPLAWKRNSSLPLSGISTVVTWTPATLPAIILSPAQSLKLPTMSKFSNSSSSSSSAGADSWSSHLMGVSSVSSWVMVSVYLSPSLASAAGQSESQLSGLSPTGRTSGSGRLPILRMAMTLMSPMSVMLCPQKMPWPLEPPNPKDETWLWPQA